MIKLNLQCYYSSPLRLENIMMWIHLIFILSILLFYFILFKLGWRLPWCGFTWLSYNLIQWFITTKTGDYLDVNSSGFHTVTVLLLYFIIIFNIFIARDIIMVYTMREKLHVLSKLEEGTDWQRFSLVQCHKNSQAVT